MGQPFDFRKRQTCLLVATFCLSAGNAYAVACPSAGSGEIRIANQTVTATCTVPNTTPTPTSIVIESTGAINVANYPAPAIQVGLNTAIGTINNSGTLQSTGNAVQVQGTVEGNITNFGTIAGTGITGGQTSEGIRLDNAVVFGTLNNVNNATITAANGNAIHLITTELDGGIHNFANAEISSAAGYAAILIEGNSTVHSGIVNEGHIGPNAVGPQNGRGLQIVGSIIYGDINNSGTIDARAGYTALQLDNSLVYHDESQAPGFLVNSGTIDASSAQVGVELINGSLIGTIENTSSGTINAAYYGISVSNSTVSEGILNAGVINAMHGVDLSSGAVVGAAGVVNDTNAALHGERGIAVAAANVIGDIVNRGLIDGAEGGITIEVGSVVGGAINNSGTITANQDAILVSSSTVNGGIVNTGTISSQGNTVRLTAATLTVGIHNAANAEIGSAGGGAAVLIESGSTVTGDIANEGHIGPTSTQNGRGLEIVGSTVNGNIINAGTIDTSNGHIGVKIDGSTVSGVLSNSGTIGTSSSDSGVQVIDGASISSIQNTSTGVINAGYPGIYISNATVTDGILNAGTINGTWGIYLNSGAVIGASGLVNDTGAAIHGERGIITYGAQVNGDIINRGLIDGAEGGITLDSGTTISGKVGNYGSITAQRDAVLVSGASTVGGDVFNYGSMTASNGYAVEVLDGSTVRSIINYQNSTISGVRASAGSVNPDAGAIYVDRSTITTGIGNAGTLSGHNGIAVTNGSSVAVGGILNLPGAVINVDNIGIRVADSVIQGTVNNGGTVTGANSGVSVSGTAQLLGGIVNSGTITGTDALNLANTGSAFIVTNSGALNGNVQLGINRLDILGSSTVGGEVAGGAGSIVNIGTDSAHIADFTPTGNFSGLAQLKISEGSTLHSRSGLAIGAANVANAGVFSIAAGHMVDLIGDYTQSSSAVLRTGLSSASSLGRLNVSGNASLASGTGIDVDVAQAAVLAVGTMAAGVVTAGGTLSGAATATVTDNSYLFNFNATSADGKTLNLTAVSAAPAPAPAPSPDPAPAPTPEPAPSPAPSPRSATSAVQEAGNPASRGAAAVFDGLIASGASGDMRQVITALGKLATARQVSDAIAQTLPLAAGATTTTTLDTMALSDRVVQARLDAGRTGGPDGDDSARAPDRGLWVMPFGAWTRQQARDGFDGYKAQSGGFALGADAATSASNRVGGAFSYSKVDLDGKGAAAQSADIDVYRLLAYGRHDIDDSTFVHWQGDIGSSQTSGHRSIMFGGLARRATSDYAGTLFHIGGDIGRDLLLDSATQFTPSLRADYATVRNKGYTESGAGALDLNVEGQRTKQLLVSANGKLTRDLVEGLQFAANLGVGYDFLGKRSRVVSTFAGGGGTFATEGADTQRFVAYGGLGLTLVKTKGLELTARYDAELRRSFSNQSISFKLAKKF